MANKPFAIQGADLTLGGVNLQAGTTGVVIPGITRATNSKVEEVNDSGDQTLQFETPPHIIDYATYSTWQSTGSADGNTFATYEAILDGEGYIDKIDVTDAGAYSTTLVSMNEGNDMFIYSASALDFFAPFVPTDWTQIPFRPKMRAGAVEREGGGGGGSELTNGDATFSLASNGNITLPQNTSFRSPEHTESWQGGDFINIYGAAGYYTPDNSQGGEGTGIGLYAGMGGESNDFAHGGRGGQLDFGAGSGQQGADGGSVNIYAGNSTWTMDSTNSVRGGDVSIRAGWANNGNQVNSNKGTGGDLTLQAGLGNHAGGSVMIKTSSDHSGDTFNNQWTFNEYGETSAPGSISVGYSGSKVATLGTGPSGFSLVGEADKSFAVMLAANDVVKQWMFGTDGSITFPDNSVQTTAYTGASGGSGFGDIYIMANVDGNIITSTDGITWGQPVPSGVPTVNFGPGFAGIGKLDVHNGVIVYTRADISPDSVPPQTGLYYSTVIGTATLCTGTDNLLGDDLFWNEVHYFAATAQWVAVGYSTPVVGNQYPVVAYSTDGISWTVVTPNPTFLNTYLDGFGGQFTDVVYNAVSSQYVISAVRTTQGPAYGGMFVTSDITVALDVSNFVDIETNGYRLGYWPYPFFGATGYIFVVDRKDDGTFGLWNGSTNNGPGGLLNSSNWSSDYGWYEGVMTDNLGYVPDASEVAFTDNMFIVTTVDGQVFVQPNIPATYVSIPLAYTSTVFDIIRNAPGDGLPTTIVFTDTNNNAPQADGEKIVISGVTSATENGSTTEQSYNGTFYIKNNNGTYELYTDQALTQPWDTSTFWPINNTTGVLTWSHGQYLDAAGVANSMLFVGNDDEQVFRSGDGINWTLEQDVTGNYFNDFAFGTFGGGSYQLTNGNKHLKLETDGTVTPPTINDVDTLQVNGNVSVARPDVGFAVTQSSQQGNVWGTSVDVDLDGNIYVAGGFYDWDWDGDDRPTVIKYSPTGERLWVYTFQYDGNNFGGISYNIEYDAGHNNVIIVIDNNYLYHRVQVVTLAAADGAVVKSDEISTVNNNSFYPRGFAIKDNGDWVIAGEAQSTVALTTGVKTGLPGSTTGVLVLPRSYFQTWGHFPTSSSNWSIKTTWGVDNYSEDYIYQVNRYDNIPTFNLIGNGSNLALSLSYNAETGEVNYESYNSVGQDYAVGDAVYVKGSNLGASTDTLVVADVGSAITGGSGSPTVITTTTPSTKWVNVAAAVSVPSTTWRAVIFNDGSNVEFPIASVTYDGNNAIITLDGDYSSQLTVSTSNIIVYNLEGTCLVYFITAVDTNNVNAAQSWNRFGHVNSDTVKLDCQNGTDFGTVFEQTFISNPGNDGSLINVITTTKASFPRWADVLTDGTWTVTDGTNTANITGSSDYGDGYITWNLDGDVLGQGTTVTIRSTIEQYQPYYSANNDAGLITSTGVELTWGTEGNNQRFNVVEYAGDGGYYVGGYGYDPVDFGDCSLVAKIISAGTATTWHTLLQGTYANADYDIHGLEVAVENNVEYIYVITYDDASNGMLYKIQGSTGDIVWCSYVLGGATNTGKYWNRGAAIRVATNGDIVVAGIAYTGLYSNNRTLDIIRVSPVDGHLLGAQEVRSTVSDMNSRYDGSEADFQFELHTVTTAGVAIEYFVSSLYTYDANNNNYTSFTIEIPIAEPVMSFAHSIFEIHNVTADLAEAVYTTTDYRTTTYSGSLINHGTLTRTANKNLITTQGPYYGNSASTVIQVLGGDAGEVAGVKALKFEDGTTQSTAYNSLMQRVTNNTNYWNLVKAEDTGKFFYCDNNVYGIQLPDDTQSNLPVGWALTIIAPLDRDIYINPSWYNQPPTIVVPGNDPQTNSNNYNGWKLKAGGMATVLKVASNTYYISGGKLETQ